MDTATESRPMGVGGSDAPIIAGLSPWKSPLQLWGERTGLMPLKDRDNAPMHWGRELERIVLHAYVEATGYRVTYPKRTMTHATIPWMYGHLDGLVKRPIRDARVVEAKTARTDRGWGEAGTDAIPAYYVPQVQHYMAVTGTDVADVPVLFAGSDFRVYTVPRDDDYIAALVELEAEFMAAVAELREPDLDGSDSATAYLNSKYPRGAEEEKVATAEQEALVSTLMELRGVRDAALGAVALAEQRVKDVMRAATVLWTPGYKVTWRRPADTTVTEWENLAGGYRRCLEQIGEWFRAKGIMSTDVRLSILDLTDPVALDAVREIVTSTRVNSPRFLVSEIKGGTR